MGVSLHGLRHRDGAGRHRLREGETVLRVLPAGVLGDHLHGVLTVQELLEVGPRHLELVRGLQRGLKGPLGGGVHFLCHGHGIAVRIINLVADREAGALRPQVGAAGGVAGDDRGRVVVHGAGLTGGPCALSIIGVIGGHPVLHRGPSLCDGVLETQGVPLEHLRPLTSGHLPLEDIPFQVVVRVGAGRPGDGQALAADYRQRNGDAGRCAGGGVVDYRHLVAGPPAGLQALAVIGFHPVHDRRRSKRDRVGGREGAALVDLGPLTAALDGPLDDVPFEVSFGVCAGSPGNGDGASAGNAIGDGDARGRSRSRVRRDRAVVRDQECRGQDQGGADAVRVVGVPAVAVADGDHAPHAAGAAGVRGAEPPVGGAAVQVRNTSLLGGGSVAGDKIVQLGAVVREVGTLVVGEAYLSTRQQENLAAQSVGPVAVGSAGAAVLTVRDFDLLDSVADVGVVAVDPGAVQVGLNIRALQYVGVPGVPHPVLSDVLPQQPGSVATGVIGAGRAALVDHDVVDGGTVLLELDDGAYRLGAKCDTCHRDTSLHENHHGGFPSWCEGAASCAAF